MSQTLPQNLIFLALQEFHTGNIYNYFESQNKHFIILKNEI